MVYGARILTWRAQRGRVVNAQAFSFGTSTGIGTSGFLDIILDFDFSGILTGIKMYPESSTTDYQTT